jgi:hypothetical protein
MFFYLILFERSQKCVENFKIACQIAYKKTFVMRFSSLLICLEYLLRASWVLSVFFWEWIQLQCCSLKLQHICCRKNFKTWLMISAYTV